MTLSATSLEPRIRNDGAKKSGIIGRFIKEPIKALATGAALTAATIGSPMLPDTHDLHASDKPAAGAIARIETDRPVTDAAQREEMVTTDGGTVYTKSKYFDLVTKSGTRDKILRDQDQFTQKDLSGKLILDQGAYKDYVDRILERAEQFKDPKSYGIFINGLRYLTGQKNYARILSPSQVNALVERFPINESANITGVLLGMLKRNESLESIKTEADRLFRLVEETGTLRYDRTIKYYDYTK